MIKIIYMPTGVEPGMVHGFPVVMGVIRYLDRGNQVIACKLELTHLNDFQSGKGQYLKASRAIPYSDLAWSICQEHINKRVALEEEYKRIPQAIRRAI